MANASQPRPYDGSKYSWDNYKFRPTYPASLNKLFLTYHAQHRNQWSLAHDVGCGNGVYAVHLATLFEHVHLSDPSADNLNAAKQRIAAYQGSHTTFTFSTTTAEDADTAIPAEFTAKHQADMITVMEAMHWVADPDKAVRAMARCLAPGGTLAMAYYGAQPRVVGNDPANAVLNELFEQLAQYDLRHSPVRARGLAQTLAGLDYVPLPEDVFERSSTRRINIHTREVAKPFMYAEDETMLPSPSMVAPGESVEYYTTGDELAEGWSFEVESDWYEGFLRSLSGLQAEEMDIKPHLEKLDAILQGAKSRIVWDVAILLTTKKI